MSKPDLTQALLAAAGAARRRKTPHFIAGATAMNYWLGKKAYRATFDVDMSVFPSPKPVIADLRSRGWRTERQKGAVTRMGQGGHPYKVDLFDPGKPLVGPRGTFPATGLLQEIRKRAVPVRMARGRARQTVRVARPEDVLVLKAVSTRLGYDKPEHARDTRRLLTYADVDPKTLRATLRRHGLQSSYRALLVKAFRR